MAKTPLFKALKRALRQAHFINQNPESASLLNELDSALKEKGLNGSAIEAQQDRRKFLKDTLMLGAAAVPLAHLMANEALAKSGKAIQKNAGLLMKRKGRSPASATTFSPDEPVTILGAGVAGLTAAYRLSRQGVKFELYEGSNRAGGRMHTKYEFNAEKMFCELGGELIDTGHKDLMKLAQDLGVEIEDFTRADAGVEPGVYWIGGKHLYDRDVIPAFQPLAEILAADIAAVFLHNDFVINYAHINEAGKKLDQMSIEQYLYSKKDRVEKWILDLINIAYIGEYGLATSQQSAINLLFLISPDTTKGFRIFGESDECKRVKGGNSVLIEALRKSISPSDEIRYDHRLVAIARSGTGFKLTFKVGNTTITKTTQQIICCLPPTMLRQVSGIDKLGLSPVKLAFIKTLGMGTNGKYMLGFKDRIWRRQNGEILANRGEGFTDGAPQAYWETSRLQNGKSGILTNFSGGAFGANLSTSNLSTILADLDKFQPGLKSYYDGNSALMRWTTYPFTLGSYSCPKPGQYASIYGAGSEPELDGRFLLAGEHCSEWFQGFMNGAVETGNIAAYYALNQRGKSLGTSDLERELRAPTPEVAAT